MPASNIKPIDVLKRIFGFETFRKGQETIVNDVLAGRNVVVIMPTGGGKSLLYQLPAVMLPGVTLVVSPLISLMKDQVDSLQALDIPATFINSSLTPAEQSSRMAGMRQGEWKLVYIAPERMRSGRFMEALNGIEISLLAVDEAHCISQWGHDFRPDYLNIAVLRRHLDNPVTAALTATATAEVRADIAAHLELESWEDHLAGFDRENLFFRVTDTRTRDDKFKAIRNAIDQLKGPGIIYAATRKNVELIANTLRMDGIPALTYHGGMDNESRSVAQNRFMEDDVALVAATNAFGMGVDKPDIRFVVHFDIPGTLEAYYQEVGRAGRDGKEALCHLLF
ncbi:RecQ family ATP-dependent DNA helicase, partial [Planctomycetota bacterium]